MKKVRRILPVSLYDIPGLESWLEEQAAQGLFPVRLGRWAVFRTGAVPGTRFRVEPWGDRGTEPAPEQLEVRPFHRPELLSLLRRGPGGNRPLH